MTAILEYYQNKYGEPVRRAEFVNPDGQQIEIFKWSEDQTKEGVAIYATSGASEYLGGQHVGCELFIGLTPEVDDIAEALAEIGLHGSGTGKVPTFGDTITLASPLWGGTVAKSIMFTCGDKIIPPQEIDGKTIQFIQLVPLFEEELQFKKENGDVALWERFEALCVPYWSSERRGAFRTLH